MTQVARGKEFAASLRAVADFYEANPTLALPWNHDTGFWVTLKESEKEHFMQYARAFGAFLKGATDQNFQISKQFGFSKIEVSIGRQAVCTPKVIGKRKVTKKIPIQFREEETEEDLIEWECPGSLLKLGADGQKQLENDGV